MKKTLLVLAFLLALWVAVSAAARHAYFLPKYGNKGQGAFSFTLVDD
jgi:hypothetical protein